MLTLYRIFYKQLFLNRRLFAAMSVASVFFLFKFFFPWLGMLPNLFFLSMIVLLIIDMLLLFSGDKFNASRVVPERLSNGDENGISLSISSRYPFKTSIELIDEIPFQFQKRDVLFKDSLGAHAQKQITYTLRPVKRGEYSFGAIRAYIRSPLGLVSRRYDFEEQNEMVPVYPSFLQMRRFELIAISNRLTDYGIKKIRRLGHSMEFDQIKNYVSGDDYRSLNWKATARTGNLMVNSFIDEKSQQVYCVIDKSRAMKMPFNGLSLLDYAINASLVLSNVALLKEDKAGLITVSDRIGGVVPAERRPAHINKILQVLYKEKSRYLELNMEALYSKLRSTLKQRSLIVFFTNFESMSAMQRQLPYLRHIARFHLLLVVFFENTELSTLAHAPAQNVEDIYIQTVAEKFAYEKKLIVKELAKYGIQSILTAPENLTVNTVNRYLEIKARQQI